ncbi:MAG TPA: HAD family phosphatase [Synergistaceae bacterium]|nr:HAD family phosphatase [Synergistaceae bacterium]HPJ25510.1 HAD family phosphatase [Synergistaceae bacterium]HPQ36037.1 HAD family phosphatase [Synergistaceae bacterium]
MNEKLKEKPQSIDTVIFDLGGVLLDWNPREYLLKHTEDAQVLDLFINQIFGSPDWNDLDRGTLSLEAGARLFRERVAPHGALFDEVWPGLFEILFPLEENTKVLEKLHGRGYRLLILSNFIEEAYYHVRKKYDFFSFFEGGVISWEIRSLKPEPEIYDTLIRRYDLNPRRSFFIDDRRENVEGARNRNLHALQYLPEKSLEEHLSFLFTR